MAQSRNEALLQALLTGEAVDIEPRTRNEALLHAQLTGEPAGIEPRTRNEEFLQALAEKGGGEEPLPNAEEATF